MTTSISNNGGNNNFDEILDRCLQAVESGQATIEQCVARYPNYPELDGLLRMAVAVRDLPRPQMAAAATNQMQRRLQAQFREQVRAAAPRRAPSFPLVRLFFTVGLILLFIFIGGAGLVSASTGSLPGDLLYPIKRDTEGVRLNLSNQPDRPGVLYDLAETRMNEIRSLAARGTAVQETWVNDMSNSVDQAVGSQTDNAKRMQLTTDAQNALQDALSKGKVDAALAQTTIQRLQFNLSLYAPSVPANTETPTPVVAVQATAVTPSAVASGTSSATVEPTQIASITLTPSFTASSTETKAAATSTFPATRTPLPTATPTATIPLPVLGPSNTPTLGRGPAVTIAASMTKAPTHTPTDTPTASDTTTEAATQAATEEASVTVAVTDTPTATATSTPTFTETSTNTATPTFTPPPKPPTATSTPTATATFTETATTVPTPNGLPAANLKQQPQETTFQNCKPEGTGGDPALNQLRNRIDEASQYPQTAFDSIAKFPWPKDAEGKPRAQWSQDTHDAIGQAEGLPVMVEVYLVKVQEDGPEAQNCNSTFHTWTLWLLGNPGSANDAGKALVASVSPRIVANHAGWTLDKLNALAAAGAKIRVSGWLMFNEEQAGEVGKSRTSLWDIHPVMQIAVAKGNQWVNLDDYQP